MESSTLRSNTAAILQALGKLGHRQDASSDLKKDEPDSMKTDVTVKEEPWHKDGSRSRAKQSEQEEKALDIRCREELARGQAVPAGKELP